VHATAFLAQVDRWQPLPVAVLHGGESHLREEVIRGIARKVLGEDEDDRLDLIRYPGQQADIKSIRDDLQTVSMFSAARVIVVDDADDFVSAHRAALEDYCEHPARVSVLILAVKSWPKNTRLAKRLPEVGVDIDCGELAGSALTRWLTDTLSARHAKQLTRDGATLLVELVGNGLGLLSQELDKLAAYSGDSAKIGVDEVRTIVGGWRTETTWEMLNAVRDGQTGAALGALHRLLQAGEAAPKLLGGINYVFRKLAQATERSRSGTPIRAALQDSGVYPKEIEAAERYLRRIGRPRAERILARLAQADFNLKGGSRLSDRLQLEQLLLSLAGVMSAEEC
jgi:DNA polymerase-3 subunit delta